jgi:glycosyltransferase involved in cell wall biosynthesis
VVVPAYNEAGFVGDVIETVPEFVDGVVVVDDHSTDGTWEEIQSHAAVKNAETAAPGAPAVADSDGGLQADGGDSEVDADNRSFLSGRVVAVRHDVNSGRGAAVKTGYRLAMMKGYDVVVVMDGDGQMDPSILDRIIEPVATGVADYAKGNRLASRDRCRQMSAWRLFGNVLLTFLTKLGSGYWRIRDPQNGYAAISIEALDEVSVVDLYDDYGFLNDLLIRLNARGMRVVDVPMDAKYGDESSGIAYRSFVPKLSLLLLRGFLWRLWVKYFDPPEPGAATDPGAD